MDTPPILSSMDYDILKTDYMKILIVDDTPANIDLLMKSLQRKGYKLSFAPNGKVALKLAEHNKPDLILLDIMMPEMDGLETCTQLKGNVKTKDIPIIFITAKVETEDVIKGFHLGGVDYIAKPFRAEEVCARVETQLALQYARKLLQNQNEILEVKVQERTSKITKLNEKLKQSLLNSVRVLVGLIEGYDAALGTHSKRVAILAVETAKKLGLTREEVFDIEIASLLHDIGTLSIPENVLNQFKDISNDKITLIRQHTMFAQSVLSPVQAFDHAGILIRHHKERIDGSGFPDGLCGTEIPLGSQIIGVANSYDEIRAKKVIFAKQAVSQKINEDVAMQTLSRLAYTYYDKNIINTLINVIKEHHAKQRAISLVSIDKLRANQILAKNLYTIKGELIVSKGTKLNNFIIQRLQVYNKAKLFSGYANIFLKS